MTFKKKVEDFVCENCGIAVTGNGFTNHCPQCLWSKHVDIDPGDREALCGGMMRPVEIETKNKELRIKHRCTICGFERFAGIVNEDSLDQPLLI